MTFFRNRKKSFISKKNFTFLILILALTVILSPGKDDLHWIAMALAMFSTMANDSIQILGTFLASNQKTKWWKMSIFVGSVFIIGILSGWFINSGRLDFMRLTNIPYQEDMRLVYFMAPIILIILTYKKVPVSTTFLILSVFASENTVGAMLLKTVSGYIFASIFSFYFWLFMLNKYRNFFKNIDKIEEKEIKWKTVQWLSTAVLYMMWIRANTSNIVVYLHRVFSVYELVLFILLGVLIIAFMMYNRGGPIQEIVESKNKINNIKSTTIINCVFAFILLFFEKISNIPIATTWVFIGILAGRETAMAHYETQENKTLIGKEKYIKARDLILKDLILAGMGVFISLIFSMISSGSFRIK